MSRTARPHAPVYLDQPDATDRFLGDLGDVREIAVDTEGASFHRFVDRIYLLQLSSRDVTAVIDPLPIGVPKRLGELLERSDVEVVFHDADYDLRLLHQDYGWHANNIFDTRIAAQLAGVRAFGLAALLERYVGVKLDKKHQRADWSMRPLPEDMLDYAALDTMYLLELRDALRDELEKKDRWYWAKEEFQRLEGTQWDEDDADGYMRTKGARDLNRRELAVFRELARWRDDVARDLDRATFRVAGNETLLEAARSQPKSMSELATVKGMPRGILERKGEEILEAVRRGLAIPDDQLPRFPRSARWERDPDFDARVARLKSVRDAAAHRLELDPGVLFSRERLEAVARKKPEGTAELLDVEGVREWQVEVMGRELVKAIKPG